MWAVSTLSHSSAKTQAQTHRQIQHESVTWQVLPKSTALNTKVPRALGRKAHGVMSTYRHHTSSGTKRFGITLNPSLNTVISPTPAKPHHCTRTRLYLIECDSRVVKSFPNAPYPTGEKCLPQKGGLPPSKIMCLHDKHQHALVCVLSHSFLEHVLPYRTKQSSTNEKPKNLCTRSISGPHKCVH